MTKNTFAKYLEELKPILKSKADDFVSLNVRDNKTTRQKLIDCIKIFDFDGVYEIIKNNPEAAKIKFKYGDVPFSHFLDKVGTKASRTYFKNAIDCQYSPAFVCALFGHEKSVLEYARLAPHLLATSYYTKHDIQISGITALILNNHTMLLEKVFKQNGSDKRITKLFQNYVYHTLSDLSITNNRALMPSCSEALLVGLKRNIPEKTRLLDFTVKNEEACYENQARYFPYLQSTIGSVSMLDNNVLQVFFKKHKDPEIVFQLYLRNAVQLYNLEDSTSVMTLKNVLIAGHKLGFDYKNLWNEDGSKIGAHKKLPILLAASLINPQAIHFFSKSDLIVDTRKYLESEEGKNFINHPNFMNVITIENLKKINIHIPEMITDNLGIIKHIKKYDKDGDLIRYENTDMYNKYLDRTKLILKEIYEANPDLIMKKKNNKSVYEMMQKIGVFSQLIADFEREDVLKGVSVKSSTKLKTL